MGKNQRFGNDSLFLYNKFEQVHLYEIVMYAISYFVKMNQHNNNVPTKKAKGLH